MKIPAIQVGSKPIATGVGQCNQGISHSDIHQIQAGDRRPPHPGFNEGVDNGSVAKRPKALTLRRSGSAVPVAVTGPTADQEQLIGSIHDSVAFLFGQGPFDLQLVADR